jgi:phage baseplate assembly protein gpV
MTATGLQTPVSVASDYAALRFIIEQAILKMQTSMPVRVVAVSNNGDLSAVGTVDVVPQVQMVSGNGQTIPHKTITGVPYIRIQGGANAIILDPQIGDLGVCLFASRDISALKADPTAASGAPPPSDRAFDFSDGIYLGGLLNGAPNQVVQFSADGIRLLSPTKVTIEAPIIELKGDVVQSGGDITATGSYTGVGDVVGDGISLSTHRHGGVTTGGGQTGVPV